MQYRPYLVTFAIILTAGAFISTNYTTDDPFITFRYAQNLVNGKGLVYNQYEHVEGFSNPTWVFLMALGMPILQNIHVLAILWYAKILGVLFTIGSAILILKSEQVKFPDRFPVATCLFCLNPSVWVWSTGGLETSLCIFLITVILYDEIVNKEAKWGMAAASILAVSRPEMPLVLITYLAWQYVAKKDKRAGIIKLSLLAIIPLIFYLGFRIFYYMGIVPNTYYAKASSWDIHRGIIYFFSSIKDVTHYRFTLPLLLIGIFLTGKYNSRLMLTLAGVYVTFIILSGGDWMPAGRFLVHIIPLICWLSSLGFRYFLEKSSEGYRKILILLLIAAVITGAILTQMSNHRSFKAPLPWESLNVESPVFPDYLEMGYWIRENIDSNNYVALGEVGIIPYVGEVNILDCFGLMDPYIAKLPGNIHYKFDATYVLSCEPEHILLLGELSDDGFEGDYLYARNLYAHELFRENYHLVKSIGSLHFYSREPDN